MQSANPKSLESIKARLASRNLGAPKNVTKTIQVANLPLPPKLKSNSTKNNQFLDKSSNILQKSSNAAAIVKSSSSIINNSLSTQISAPAITSSINPSTSNNNNYNKNKLFTDMKNHCKLERARISASIQFDNHLSRSASSSSQMSSGSSTTTNPSLQNTNNNDSNQIKKIDRIKEKIRNQKAQRIMAIIDQDSDIPENLRLKIKKKASNKVLGQEIHSVNSKVQKMSVAHCQVNNDNNGNDIQISETSSLSNSTNNNKTNNKTTPKLQKSASLFDNYRAEKIAKCIPKNQNDPQKQQTNVNSDLENSSNNHQKLVQAAKNRRKALQKMVGINVKDFNENQKAIRQTMLANLAERKKKQEELKEREKEKEKEKQEQQRELEEKEREKQKQKLIEQQIIDENNENLMTSLPPRAQYRSMLAPLRNSGVKKR